MTFEAFKQSIQERDEPPPVELALQALWVEKKGDWERAHELCQEAGNQNGDWVHAYLHRKEGDESNASYWYHRSGKSKPSTLSLDEEWEMICGELCE